ncbi:MAG: ribosome biogenesis GTPase Der [Caulobacteraceae bacterium]
MTRDRRFGTGRLGDLDLELIDTAGFEDVDDESLTARMQTQTEIAITEADVILFVFDAREGLTPLDGIFAEVLRRQDKPVVVVANKTEGRAGEIGAMEAFSLGMGEPVPISATHGEGLSDLYEAVIAATPADVMEAVEEERGDKPIRIAIVGRPNAGKSTLVKPADRRGAAPDRPRGRHHPRRHPGRLGVGGRPVRLVDTAGLRRKAKVQEKLEKLSTQDTLRAITFAEVVILVMDAANAFEISRTSQIADLCEREGRGLVYVLAKWDLVTEPQARLAELQDVAERSLPQLKGTPVVALSAETGRGLERLMPAVLKVHHDWSSKVKTRDLNDWLKIAVQRHPPPAVNGKRVRPKYMAQIKARPPTFVMFASRPDQLPDSYKRYLVNGIRQSFDLPGVPIRLSVRAGKNPYAEARAPLSR